MQFVMTIGPKGQVVIPKAFRDDLNLMPGDEIVLSNEQKTLTLQKKSEQTEKIMAEIAEFAKKYGRKEYNPINLDEELDEEMDESIKRWKLPK